MALRRIWKHKYKIGLTLGGAALVYYWFSSKKRDTLIEPFPECAEECSLEQTK